MNAEMMALRARVAALERALAVATDTNRADERRRGTTVVVLALASVAVMVTLLFLTAPIPLRAAGPTSVTAPFTVVDGSGRLLMRVLDDPSRGAVVSLYNAAARGVVEIGASPSGCCGTVRVFNGDDNAQPRAMIGVNENDTGGLQLTGLSGGFAQVSGKGVVFANADKRPIAFMGQAGDNGYFELRNDSVAANATLWASKDGGGLEIKGGTGNLAATLDAAGGPGKMTIFGGGAARTTIGVSADDAGLVRLASGGGNAVMLHGVGVLKTMNASGREVVDIGVDPHGNGVVDVRHSAGVGGVRLDVSDNGAGNLKVHAPPFEIMAQIGIKEGGKGDVCVMGGKGLICLSGVAAKSLIPW
jgi:hypothetical protein